MGEVCNSHVDFQISFAGFYLHTELQEHVNFASSYILKDLHSLTEYVSKNYHNPAKLLNTPGPTDAKTLLLNLIYFLKSINLT